MRRVSSLSGAALLRPASFCCHGTHTCMPDMSCAVLCGAHWKEEDSVSCVRICRAKMSTAALSDAGMQGAAGLWVL